MNYKNSFFLFAKLTIESKICTQIFFEFCKRNCKEGNLIIAYDSHIQKCNCCLKNESCIKQNLCGGQRCINIVNYFEYSTKQK